MTTLDSAVATAVAADIRRHGPLPLDRVLDRALYDRDGGFYEAGGRAGGRTGDFLTSPEVGPLFGAVVARALDAWWRSLGEPDPYVVVEAGAGPGTLCRTVLAAAPDCAPALRYVLVERSAAQRRLHGERIRLEDPALAFAPVDPDTEAPVRGAPTGPICVSLGELPRIAGPAVVLANELLDNLPFSVAERRDGGWLEVRVDLAPAAQAAGGDRLIERLVPVDAERSALLDRLVAGAAEGGRVPLQEAARAWLREALTAAGPRGRVVAIDYASTTAALAARPPDEWLRTYRGHARGGAALDDLGHQDITCEVATDQLALVRPPASDTSQADWLRSHGIDDLVDEGRRTWAERAHVADVAALAARSRVTEAEALLDPGGLGAFRVLEWFPRL
jgi:NADH dehydrogenase [ubiquinone] 1 alpha subcomplex assembly factor 7